MKDTYAYVPGSCNLGEAEVRRRYRIGYTGLAATIILIAIIELTNANPGWKFLLIIPVFYSISGFVQAKKKFCYIYGYKGVASIAGRKKFEKISDDKFQQQDRKTVLQLLTIIVFGTMLITGAYYFLFP